MDDVEFDYEAQADEFRSASELLAMFGTPEGARELIDVLTSDDHERFHELVNRVTWPETDPRLICRKSCELIGGHVGRAVVVTTCKLRTGLSRAERVEYLLIWLRHFGFIATPRPAGEPRPFVVAAADVIPEGPFLDDLRAAGLVTCTENILRPHFHCEIVCD